MTYRDLRLCIVFFLTAIMGLAGCGGGGGGGGDASATPKDDVSLVSIELTPGSHSLPKGVTQQYTATGIYSDSSTQDLSDQVTWDTSDHGLASVDAAGLLTAILEGGPITVSATFDTVEGTTPLTVTTATLVSIDVTPASLTLANGLTQQYAATGSYSDGSTIDLSGQVSWDTSNHAVASIGDTGLATALSAGGPISVSATLGAISNSASLTVTGATLSSIDVTPASQTLPKGVKQQYAATGHYSDGSTSNLTATVTWASSDASVASIGNAAGSRGLATALKVGSTTISAKLGAITGTNGLSVTAASLQSIQVTAPSASMASGFQQQYTATGVYSDGSTQNLTTQVVWGSSNSTVAGISNSVGSKGLATAKTAGGPVDIVAVSGAVSGKTTLTVSAATLNSIEVSADSPTLPTGVQQQYSATGLYSDGSTSDLSNQVTWASSDSSVASISNASGSRGLATTLAAGSTTISATLAAVTGGKALSVTTVSLQSVEVTAASDSLAIGFKQTHVATGVYSDGSTLDLTDQVTWTSSDTTVASISNAAGSRGLATALKAGSTTISANLGGVTGSKMLGVSSATLQSIEVTADNLTLARGSKQAYTATGLYSDGSSQDLTTQVVWRSSDTAVASISNTDGSRGLATAKAAGGPVYIIAVSGSVSGATTLTVSAATLNSIEVSANSPTLPSGLQQQYSATGLYSDGSKADLSDQVIWASSNAGVASISNSAGTRGLASALTAGSTSIGATLGAVSGGTTLNVTAAALASIEVTAEGDSLAIGFKQLYTATGIYSDGSTLDLTDQVTWTSSDTNVASVSNASGSRGLASALSAGGPISIEASFDPGTGTVTGSVDLTVIGATLTAIEVTSDSDTLVKGIKQQYTATGTFSDGSSEDLTHSVIWSAEADTSSGTPVVVASISNAADSQGLLTALEAGGPVEISATIGSGLTAITGGTPLTVSAATLLSLTVEPLDQRLPQGLMLQYVATGTYSDDTTLDLTRQVIWTSSDASVASISNAEDAQGLATGVAAGGPITISARLGGDSPVSTSLTVTTATLSSISVTPANLNLPRHVRQPYTASANFSDGTTLDITRQATWASSNTTIATISNSKKSRGLARTLTHGGPINISAMLSSFSPTPGTTTLTVNNLVLSSIAVMPASTTCGSNKKKQFSAIVTYADSSTQDLTSVVNWKSGNNKLVTIGQHTGLAKTSPNRNRTGSTSVFANLAGTTGSATLTKNGTKSACTP